MSAIPLVQLPEPAPGGGHRQLQLPPLALYIHVPWCIRKCPYCDFNSHKAPGNLPEMRYVDALLADLATEAAALQGRTLVSIFIGGGTPSLLTAAAYERLFAGIRQQLSLTPAAFEAMEITLEANPGTVEQARFDGFRAAGINRLSLGIQSFDDASLKALGRVHDGQQAAQAVTIAQRAGFERINLDLMHGLPGQTVQQALADLRQGLAFGTGHLSWYQLTIEPNTLFWNRTPVLPEEEVLWSIRQQGQALLQEHGLQHYEISAFSHPGLEARHNRNYWQFGDFIGIGAGAHGKITQVATGQADTGKADTGKADTGRITRRWKKRRPDDYLAALDRFHAGDRQAFVAGERQLTTAELPLEFLMNALRLTRGVPASLYEERTGLSLEALQPRLSDARRKDLLAEDDTRLRASEHGLLFLDSLLELFCPTS